MSKIKTLSFLALIIFVMLIWFFSETSEPQEQFPERVKISLRDVGNQLLLTRQDTTSLILPVIALEELKYELSFENPLAITPDSLVTIVKRSFEKAALPNEYLVEVIQCEDQEVAYSKWILK